MFSAGAKRPGGSGLHRSLLAASVPRTSYAQATPHGIRRAPPGQGQGHDESIAVLEVADTHRIDIVADLPIAITEALTGERTAAGELPHEGDEWRAGRLPFACLLVPELRDCFAIVTRGWSEDRVRVGRSCTPPLE